ncbi:hypothetical protein NL676_025725 [Syzygium grande]|nr:hypothetical protein NL676_025725 [Syzygium grande]
METETKRGEVGKEEERGNILADSPDTGIPPGGGGAHDPFSRQIGAIRAVGSGSGEHRGRPPAREETSSRVAGGIGKF